MELRQLRYFVEIARELHYRRAADRLFISQPALSQQIRLLEEELGVELFVRSRRTIQRKVELTEAGTILLKEVQQLLRLSQQAMDATRQAGRQQPIRMGVFKTLLRSRIIDVMNLLTERIPQATVKIVELPSFLSVQQAPVENSIDLGLTILPLQYSSLEAIPFAKGTLSVLLPRQHPLAQQEQITLAQLQHTAWVEVSSPLNPVFDVIERLCEQAGYRRQVVQEVNSLALLAEFVQLGKGVALIPSHFNTGLLAGVIAKPLVNQDGIAYAELELQHVVAFLPGNAFPAIIALRSGLSPTISLLT
jgi:DNA-binding transcriptional LysR family regulator